MSRRDGEAIAVRVATPDDHDGAVALAALDPAARRLLGEDLVRDDLRHVVVATAGPSGSVVGLATATRQLDASHVLDLVVAVPWRRRGVASRLLALLAALVGGDGTPSLTLEVRAGNAGARALYEALGFEDVGIRPGYYQDGEDAHVLWHHDLDSLARSVDGPTGP